MIDANNMVIFPKRKRDTVKVSPVSIKIQWIATAFPQHLSQLNAALW